MDKPRLLGSLIIFYLVGLYKLWELFIIFVVMRAVPIGRIDTEGFVAVSDYALIALYGPILLFYGIGSAGLLFKRGWSAGVVFYAAIVEATVLLAVLLYGSFDALLGNLPPLSVLPLWLLLVFPAGFGYAARKLRKNPELWQAPQEIPANSTEPFEQVQASATRPALLQKIFWIIVGTGLLQPALLGLITKAVSLVRGEATHVSESDLLILLLGTPLFALPYIVLALIGRPVLRRAFQEGGDKQVRKAFILAGVFFGMTASVAPSLYSFFSTPEALAVLILAPIAPFSIALPGIVVGAVVGLVAHSGWKFFTHSDGDSKQ